MASSAQQIFEGLAGCVAKKETQLPVADCSGTQIVIEGRAYSCDDPAAIKDMTGRGRQTFWQSCSDAGRDSEAYRTWATQMLFAETDLSLADVTDVAIRSLITNRMHNFCELVGACQKAGCRDWQEPLLSSSVEKLSLMLQFPPQMSALLGALRQQSTPNPLSLLTSLDEATLKDVLQNARTHVAEAAHGVNLAEKWCPPRQTELPEEPPAESSGFSPSC